jgi:integrase
MGRRSLSGGVAAKGADRIEFTFVYNGKRVRPTLKINPSEANLRRARVRLVDIKRRIANGTFVFADEFPDYKLLDDVAPPPDRKIVTFNDVADAFLTSAGDLAHSTRESYRKILMHHWRPQFGTRELLDIKASELKTFIGSTPWDSNKTRNNVVSAGRRVFEFGYDDHPELDNPAEKLKSLRVQRARPDPFTLEEAETIIAGILKDWGPDDADYVEFQFFAGARPSETIAASWPKFDRRTGVLRISEARVMAQDKKTTKTSVERDVELNPRALAVIKRRRPKSELLKHGRIFTIENGEPFHDLQRPWNRWQFTLKRLGIRYREPYQARHTSVTWNLMIGKNPLWVAEMHGHSVAVMLKTYAKWLKGTSAEEIATLERAMGFATDSPLEKRESA